MAGVTATDDTDGDLTDAVQLIGSFDPVTPGVYMLTYVVEDANGNQATAPRTITVTEAEDGCTPGGDQAGDDDDQGGADDTGQNADGGDTATDAEPAGGTDTTGGGNSADGTSNGSSAPGASTDVEIRKGFLANTGANGTVLLVLGGLLSVAAGVTAWQISRRRNAMN